MIISCIKEWACNINNRNNHNIGQNNLHNKLELFQEDNNFKFLLLWNSNIIKT